MTNSDPHKARQPVYLLSADSSLSEQIAQALVCVGLGLHRLAGPDALAAAGAALSDAVLILDTRCLPPGVRIDQLFADRPRPAVLIGVAHPDALELRLEVVRAGARACYLVPVDVELLAARLAALVGSNGAAYRVLVVDDEPIAAAFAVGVLERAGFETRVVADALRVIEAVEAFRPNLVLMDLHMPGASGIELTGLIREHEGHGRLPIVFLSSELDPDQQVAALRVGGDDFLSKPMSAERLLEVVRDRISRAVQTGWAWAGRDPATGLGTHDALLKHLDKAIAWGAEREPGLGLILITPSPPIQGPRRDAALAAIAETVRRHLRPQELLARSADSELALFAMRPDAAALDALVRSLAQAIRVDAGVHLALGLARFTPPPDDVLALIARARAAMGRPDASAPPWSARGLGALSALIEAALAGRGLELRYQPVVALRGRPAPLYEVSLRLRAPNGEYASHAEVRSVARSCSLMGRVDQWLLEHSLDALRDGQALYPGLRFLVPLTAAGVADPDWSASLRDQILSRDLVRCRPLIRFEARELAAEPGLLAQRFAELHRLGIGICIGGLELEPVGLALIEGLPVSCVSLARGALGRDPGPLAAQVAALQEAGRRVIAAGVDDPADVPRVWTSGVDLMQGSLLQLPSPELGFDFTEIVLG